MIKKVIKQRIIKYGQYAEHVVFANPHYVHMQTPRDYSRSAVEERREDSLTRTRMRLYRLIHANVGAFGRYPPVFLTLTYAENRTNIDQSHRDFKYFIRKLKIETKTNLKYVAIPEFQERGAIHYHVMFFNLPFIRKEILAELWSFGWIRIEAAHLIRNLAAYMAKYMSKDILDSRLAGRRLLLTAQGLKKEIIYEDNEIVQFREKYILGKQESYIRTPKKKIITYKIWNL